MYITTIDGRHYSGLVHTAYDGAVKLKKAKKRNLTNEYMSIGGYPIIPYTAITYIN